MPPPPPPPPLPSSPASFYCVDQRTWRVCAGACVRIPALHSRVFYFPQGHLEQQSSSDSLDSVLPPSGPLLRHQNFVGRAVLPCVVSSVDFMADSCTDEVFVRFRLRPDNGGGGGGATRGSDCRGGGSAFEDKVLTYAKTLTPSDANNGGGFSVPRYCADFIFPKLNFAVDPPVQVLAVQDVNGTVWNFRHIYRGTPRRHLLTTGWSKFVNSKKLVAGDTVIFMRDPECTTDEMSVGIRRASRAGGMAQCARWRQMMGGGGNVSSDIEEGSPNGLLGASKGKEEEVARAMEQWMSREEFEVVYHPTRIGGGVGTAAEFVIAREAVEEAAGTFWGGGMRVKMALEAEDCSRITFLQGTVSGVEIPKDGTWRGSPWRMLQIMWDEPDVMKDKKFVSPWQVEAVAPVTPLHPSFHPLKKLRCPMKSGLQTDGDIDSLYPWTGYGNMPSGHLISQSVIYNSPFGMQGSRQDESNTFGLFHYVNGNAPMRLDSFIGNMLPKLDTISIDLNKGSSQSENVLPGPTDGVHTSRGERVHRGAKAAKVSGAGNGSIQLFGQIIHPKNPVEDPLAEATAKEINGLKVPSGGPECANPLLDLSLLTCLNGLNNGIAEAQMLNHVVL